MKATKTYTNFITSSILLAFVLCFFIDIESQDNSKTNTLDCIDSQGDYIEFKTISTIFTIVKTNSSPALLQYRGKHQNSIAPIGITLNISNLKLSSKVGLFILYSSLKLAPIS